jgi:class 3 adenylate cyclase
MERDLDGVATKVILFTDLVDSTGFDEAYGVDVADATKRRVAFMTNQALSGWKPEFIKSTGDGFLAVFSSASGAIRAAAAAQHAMAALRRRTDFPEVHLRIGISAGDVLIDASGDVGGTPVNEASRLEGRADTDGILVSRVVRDLERGRSRAGFGEPQEVQLRGLNSPTEAMPVRWSLLEPELPAAIPLPPQLEDALQSPFPFADREILLSQVRSRIEPLSDDRRTVVFVTGTSGVGKSRFLAELADGLRNQGTLVLVGHCVERGDVPFQCFREILDSFCGRAAFDAELASSISRTPSLARLSPQVGKLIPSSRGADAAAGHQHVDVDDVVSDLHVWMTRLARRQEVVVILEDLHYASDEVLSFLRHLSALPGADAPAIVCAVNKDLATEALAASIDQTLAHGVGMECELPPLSAGGVSSLLVALPEWRLNLGATPVELGSDGEKFSEFLYRVSGGLPSLVTLLVREARDKSLASMDEDGVWRLTGDISELEGLRTYQRIVGSRLRGVSALARDVARQLAVLGTPTSLMQFGHLNNLPSGERDVALKELQEARLLTRKGPELWFETEAVERAVYNSIDAEARGALHVRAAEAIELHTAEEGRRIPYVDIADHLERAYRALGSGAPRVVSCYCLAAIQALDDANGMAAEAALAEASQIVAECDPATQSAIEGRIGALRRLARAAASGANQDLGRGPDGVGESPEQIRQYFSSQRDQSRFVVASDRGTSPPRVFVSYNRQDSRWLERLKVHLQPLVRAGTIDLWDDGHLQPGDMDPEEIAAALAQSQAAILLVSADFLASDFLHRPELPGLLDGARERGVRIMPLLLSASSFRSSPIARFQAFNPPKTTLDQMRPADQEQLLSRVAEEIAALGIP